MPERGQILVLTGGRPAERWRRCAARYNGTHGSWHRAGFDTHAITRSLSFPSEATLYLPPEDHKTLRVTASARFSSRLNTW